MVGGLSDATRWGRMRCITQPNYLFAGSFRSLVCLNVFLFLQKVKIKTEQNERTRLSVLAEKISSMHSKCVCRQDGSDLLWCHEKYTVFRSNTN